MTLYCAPPSGIRRTSLESRCWRKSAACGPRVSISPMWETSKTPARGAHGVVLGADAVGVLDRHLPAGESDEPRSGLRVPPVERGATQLRGRGWHVRETTGVLELRPRDADVARWRDLAARAADPNPFFEPELLLPAVRHLKGGGEVRLLVAERAGRVDRPGAGGPAVALARAAARVRTRSGSTPTASSGRRCSPREPRRRRPRRCSMRCGGAPRSCRSPRCPPAARW